MDSSRIKAVIDLHDYMETLGNDRPPIGVFLKKLNIHPNTMSDCVKQAAVGIHVSQPEFAIEIANYLFKLGVTIGYKYAISKTMEKEFGVTNEDEQPN